MESTAIQAIFDRDGYIALPVFVNRHKVDEINRELDRVLTAQLPYLPPENVFLEDPARPETVSHIRYLQRYDDYFGQLLASEKFQLVAETVLKSPVIPVDAQYFNKPPGANSPTPPHQDGHALEDDAGDTVELWLALDDADDDTGCIYYVRGSHVLGLLPHHESVLPGSPQCLVDDAPCEDTRNCVPVRVRAGDLLAHHALTIHWTHRNESNHRHRRALTLVYQRGLPETGSADESSVQEPLGDLGSTGAT